MLVYVNTLRCQSPALSSSYYLLNPQGGAEWEVAPNLVLGDDYVMLPKPLWDIMVDWYGGGPVFSRKVVNVSSSLSVPLQLPEKARDASTTMVSLSAVDERGAGLSSPSRADRYHKE